MSKGTLLLWGLVTALDAEGVVRGVMVSTILYQFKSVGGKGKL